MVLVFLFALADIQAQAQFLGRVFLSVDIIFNGAVVLAQISCVSLLKDRLVF